MDMHRPPHCNLLYPFVAEKGNEDQFEEAVERLREAVKQCPPFTVNLTEASHFKHNRRTATVWLRPETPNGELGMLQERLNVAFHGGNPHQGTHHLSVGQFRPGADTLAGEEEIRARATETKFFVDAIHVMTRRGFHSPFQVRNIIPLATAEEPNRPSHLPLCSLTCTFPSPYCV